MSNIQESLVIVMEECAEIQQAAAKGFRFGLQNINPYNGKATNADDIMLEFLQLTAVIEQMQIDGTLPSYSPQEENEIKATKIAKIAKWQKG